jgi:2-polyprenyl-3-methyl-5-hydroxy-6-metoxy-1,4-benzoquinol methylase
MTSASSPGRRPPAEERFTTYYATSRPPWDIGRPQRCFTAAGIGGRVLDLGCGTGDLAVWLAARGCAVTGVDFLAAPLAVARTKAAEQGVAVNFLQMDARAVATIPERFDAVTDCGLFHSFDDAGRAEYVSALERLLEPGARFFMLCVSELEPGTHGPRRVTAAEIRAAFAAGWQIEALEGARFEVSSGVDGVDFTPGGAHAWFATVRRVGPAPAGGA